MSRKYMVRVWQEIEIDDVEPRLLVWGKISGDCWSCKEVGVSLESIRCPKCQTAFKYLAMRDSNSIKEASRIQKRRSDLVFIDLHDFKEAQAKKKAHGFLGD